MGRTFWVFVGFLSFPHRGKYPFWKVESAVENLLNYGGDAAVNSSATIGL